MLSLIELQSKKVEAKRKKYDKDEMDSYLELVFENYKELLNQNKQLEAEKGELNQKVKKLSDGVQYYRSIETTLQKALILAEKTSKETKDAALLKAEAIEKDANKRADEIIRNAEGEYSKIKGKCIHLVQQFTQYKSRLIEAASAQLELVEGDEFDIEAPKEYSQAPEQPVKQEQPAPAPAPTPVPEPAPVPDPVVPEPAPAPVMSEPAPAPVVSEPAPVSNPVVPEPTPVSNPVVPEPAPVSNPVVPEPALVSDPVVSEPVPTLDTIASGQITPKQEDELAAASLKPERTTEEILQADTIDLRNTLDAIQAFEQKNTLDLDLQPITQPVEEQGQSDFIEEQQPAADLTASDIIGGQPTAATEAESSLLSMPDDHIDTASVKNMQTVDAAFVEPVQAKPMEPLDAMFEEEFSASDGRSKNTEKLDPPAKEPETVPTLDALLQDLNINNKSNQKSDDPFEFLGSIDDDF